MKILKGLLLLILFAACKESASNQDNQIKKDTIVEETIKDTLTKEDSTAEEQEKTITKDSVFLHLENAENLAKLPLDCIQMQYPNKLDHVISSATNLEEPQSLHPAFYGCFDWHSSVHGHWALIRLLKEFPELARAEEIKEKLLANISKENIRKEVNYFKTEVHRSSERPYGWAWLLKLAEEIHTWDDEISDILEINLQPLTNLMVENFKEFLPKLTKPIRVGEHQNTAFALVFVYDYAETLKDKDLKELIKFWAKSYYLHDKKCPINYEPGGFDFLSPCLEEIDIMQRVLSEKEFKSWLKKFMPEILEKDFKLKPGEVSDREDGKLVHLDGLNFSRAWILYDLANKYQELKHLRSIADQHFHHSFENILDDDSYMGGHWLSSFALYALEKQKQ